MTQEERDKIEALRQRWETGTLKRTLERSPERQAVFKTTSGIPLERVYTPLDVDGLDLKRDLAFPGEYPFTRGVQPTMYRGRLWTMRQYAGFGTAEETNRRFQYLLQQGQTGLSVAFDLPTQMGYDSDHPMVAGEVGKVGVAIDSLADMERLLQGLPLDQVSTSMTINATAAILLCMYIAVAERQGIPRSADAASRNKMTAFVSPLVTQFKNASSLYGIFKFTNPAFASSEVLLCAVKGNRRIKTTKILILCMINICIGLVPMHLEFTQNSGRPVSPRRQAADSARSCAGVGVSTSKSDGKAQARRFEPPVPRWSTSTMSWLRCVGANAAAAPT